MTGVHTGSHRDRRGNLETVRDVVIRMKEVCSAQGWFLASHCARPEEETSEVVINVPLS